MNIQEELEASKQELLIEHITVIDENWVLTGEIRKLKKIRDRNLIRKKFIEEQIALHDFELDAAECEWQMKSTG